MLHSGLDRPSIDRNLGVGWAGEKIFHPAHKVHRFCKPKFSHHNDSKIFPENKGLYLQHDYLIFRIKIFQSFSKLQTHET